MKKALIILAFCSLFASLNLSAQAQFNAGASEGFILMQDLAMWQDDWGKLKFIEALTLGDKVQILGKVSKFTQDGNEREYQRVKAASGKEGWIRSSFVAINSTLAVVKADAAVVYSEARDVKITNRIISHMTLVAVSKNSATAGFVKVNAWDMTQESIIDQLWVSNTDLTYSDTDINAIILYRVAQSKKSADIKKNLLTLLNSKYGKSIFIDKINGKPAAAAPAAPKTIVPATGIYITTEKNINVRSAPDEKADNVVTMLSDVGEVEIIEKTTQSYTIGNLSAPWYHIKSPDGWVFGAFLSPKP